MRFNRKNKTRSKISSRLFNELSAKNVKKSRKDYFIYFFTLMLSVCLFYSFNSVSTQFASLGLDDKLNYLAASSAVLTGFSVIVCIIMGALVVYANRYLLRRRKKEMGIYATLGMDRRDLNRLLMRETLRIGIFSLASGLVLGIFAAQILSLITAKLARINLSSYRFMISGKAIVLSIVFFGILFYFVHLFNIKELKKISLLEMLYAERKNEQVQRNGRAGDIFIFVLSVALMLGGYAVIYLRLEADVMQALGIGGVMLIAGTMMFFTSVLGTLTRVMKHNKQTYFRGLNIFMVSQFSSRAKTEGRSHGLIAVLLYLALTLVIIGPGMGKYIVNGIENADPYDATISYYPEKGEELGDPMKELKNAGFHIKSFSNSYQSFWTYTDASLTESSLITQKGTSDKENERMDITLTVIGVGDYNRMLKLQGKSPIQLGKNEYALSHAFPTLEKVLKAFAKHPKVLSLGGSSLNLAENGIHHNAWESRNVLQESPTVVVPQSIVKNLTPESWILNLDFSGDKKQTKDKLYDRWNMVSLKDFTLQTGAEAVISIVADNLMLTYLGIYLSITFLITAGAVVALQQLFQSSDNKKRYELLKKLGASQNDLREVLEKQLKVYFGFPMVAAVFHSIITVIFTFRYLEGMTIPMIVSVIGFGGLLIFAVYGVYFVATYTGSRRILKL